MAGGGDLVHRRHEGLHLALEVPVCIRLVAAPLAGLAQVAPHQITAALGDFPLDLPPVDLPPLQQELLLLLPERHASPLAAWAAGSAERPAFLGNGVLRRSEQLPNRW